VKLNPWLKSLPAILATACLMPTAPILAAPQAPIAIAQAASSQYNKYMRQGYSATARRDYRTALVNFRRALSVRPGDAYATVAVNNVSRYARRGKTGGFIASNRGAPGTRQGGATRGGCVGSGTTLTALVPDNNVGMTTTQYPVIFFYVPQTSAQVLELSLLDENDNEIYQKNLTPNKTGGIASVNFSSLPGLKPLEVGKSYHWYLSIVCNTKDRSADIFVDSWVQRIKPDPALQSVLQQAPMGDRSSLYAVNGIWYDSLAALYETRKSNPNNSGTVNEWTELLNSVGLDKVAKEPLVPCCTATN
jgi:Domain of Unknown Function (DUF928)